MISLGPISVSYFLVMLVLSLLTKYKYIDEMKLFFSFKDCFLRGELWRYFTGIVYLGNFDTHIIIAAISYFLTFNFLETKKFSKRRGSLIFIYLLMIFNVNIAAVFCNANFTSLIFLVSMNIFAAKVVGKEMGNVAFPYVSLVIQIVSNGFRKDMFVHTIVGLFIGHFIYYVLYLLPVISGRAIFKTPALLCSLFDAYDF